MLPLPSNINKDSTVFDRDESGNLLAKEVELETLPENKYSKFGIPKDETPTVEIKPVPRGKFNRLVRESQRQEAEADGEDTITDADRELLGDHLAEPDYSDQELEDLNDVDLVEAYIAAIQAVSLGVPQEKIKDMSAEERIEAGRDGNAQSFQ